MFCLLQYTNFTNTSIKISIIGSNMIAVSFNSANAKHKNKLYFLIKQMVPLLYANAQIWTIQNDFCDLLFLRITLFFVYTLQEYNIHLLHRTAPAHKVCFFRTRSFHAIMHSLWMLCLCLKFSSAAWIDFQWLWEFQARSYLRILLWMWQCCADVETLLRLHSAKAFMQKWIDLWKEEGTSFMLELI